MALDTTVTNPVMREAIRAFDWGSTAIGRPDSWPQSLRTALSLALDTPFPMMIMWGRDLVQLYNDGYIGILGDKHPRSIGQGAAECWADIWDSVGPMLLGVIERGEPVYYENLPLPMTRHGGVEEAYFTFSYSAIREGGDIAGLICIVNETTAHVLRERESDERAAAFAELDRAKTEFFNNVSHEFRTPLTLMLGPLEELTRTLPEYEQRRTADLARRNAIRLQRLVNTLLDFSLVQSGLAAAQQQPVAIDLVTSAIVSEFRSAYEAVGLSLEFQPSIEAAAVLLDRAMYEKVVLNLLSNALKFTFTGGVFVSTAREAGEIVLRVRDTGIGIDPSHHTALFERFRRIESARSRTHEGTGIGLALVSELVGLQGGRIEVESALEQGTTFSVRLPYRPAPEGVAASADVDTTLLRRQYREEAEGFVRAAESAAASAPAGAPRVLVADDNADLRSYLSRMLSSRYAVEVVADGITLLERARASVPDIVIVDVMMPNLDGFGVVRALRDDPLTADIPIILLSARAGEEAAVDGLRSGADDYIVKPFVAADLVARLDALLRRTRKRNGTVTERHDPEQRRFAELLSAAADRFIAAIDTDAVASAITAVLTPRYAEWSSVTIPQPDGRLEIASLAHREPAKAELGAILNHEYPSRMDDGSMLAAMFENLQPVLIEHVTDDLLKAAAHDTRHYAVLATLDLRSAVVVPVVQRGVAVAAITAVRAEGHRPFTQRDVEFLTALAGRAALAFESARVYERERTIASTLQRALLPGTLPAVSGLHFSASYTPAAQESLIGGDWYDAFETADGSVVVSIGDVVGHGIEAATVMGALRQAVRSFAVENNDPATVLTHLNRLLIADEPGRLATALVARVHPQTLEMTLASAGHHAPLRIVRGDRAGDFRVDGLMLGVADDAVYATERYGIAPGELIAFFTDGYVENDRDIERAEVRLAASLLAAYDEPNPAARVHLDIFGAEKPRDDAALLTMFAEPVLPSLTLRVPAVPHSAPGARTALRRFLASTNLSPERRDDVLVAAGEAVINVIEHAYPGAPGDVLLTASLQGESVVVEVSDFGGWNPGALQQAQRGYGLPLMHAFADGVEIERGSDGTRVRLVTTPSAAAAEPAPSEPVLR